MFFSDGSGILDMDGAQMKSARVENVSTLPTTTYGVGRGVFYSGAPYWWTGSQWLSIPPSAYKTLHVDIGYPNVFPYFSSVANAQNYARTNLSGYQVLFDIYNTVRETITFNSSDNYILSMRYNVGTPNLDRGSLTIAATYTNPFAIDGHGVFEYFNILGGSANYTSMVNIAKVTSQSTIYTNYRLYVYIAEANTIHISASGGSAASPQSCTEFRLGGKYCTTMLIASGGTVFNYLYGRFAIDTEHVAALSYSGVQGGEYHINCRTIGTLSVSCGDATLSRDTHVFINGTYVLENTTISGHTTPAYYLYTYFRNTALWGSASYDNVMSIEPVTYAKIFIDNSALNGRFAGQYGIKVLPSSEQRATVFISYSKIISTAASIYNPNTKSFPVVAQYSTCRQAISGVIGVTGTLTQNTAFF